MTTKTKGIIKFIDLQLVPPKHSLTSSTSSNWTNRHCHHIVYHRYSGLAIGGPVLVPTS